jgi:flotillin
MEPLFIFIIGGIAAVLIIAVVLLYRFQYRKVGPNEILIISGGRKNFIELPDGSLKEIGFRFRIGGGTFVNPLTERAEKLVIEVIPIHLKSPEVITKNGIPIVADYSAQVSIDTTDYAIYLATTHFLGSGREGIREVTQTVLEGRVREVIGTMTVEDILSKRNEFSAKVYQGVKEELANVGLVMKSFALQDVNDMQGYIDALSKPQIAAAKYHASVDQSEKDKAIAVKTAEAKKEGEIARLAAEAEIAAKSWDNEAKKAASQVSVNQKKAQADMSYELERNKILQNLTKEEYAVKKVEMEEAIKLEDMNIRKKNKELEANVIQPAEARKKQVMSEAEAEKYRIATEAEGKKEARIQENETEAERIRQLGSAEADAIAKKAKAYEQYNQAAIYEMIMAKLPEIAQSISEPLSKLDKIVMIENDGKLGTSKITGQVAEILSQLPEVIEALTGADIRKILKDKLSKEE